MKRLIFFAIGFVLFLVGISLSLNVETAARLWTSAIISAMGIILMVIPCLLIFSKKHIVFSIFSFVFSFILAVGIFCAALWFTDIGSTDYALPDKVFNICLTLSLPFLLAGGSASAGSKICYIIFI